MIHFLYNESALKKQRGRTHRAQVSLEVAALIACLVAGLVGMGVFVKRGVNGYVNQITEDLGDPYDPHKTVSAMRTELHGVTKEEYYPFYRDLDGDGERDEWVRGTHTHVSMETSRSGEETVAR